jgi:hypothetical protein
MRHRIANMLRRVADRVEFPKRTIRGTRLSREISGPVRNEALHVPSEHPDYAVSIKCRREGKTPPRGPSALPFP